MIRHSLRDLARVDAAEARLARVSIATGGHGVEAIWIEEADRSDPRGLPDALYVNRGNPYAPTLLYDVRRAAFVETAWGDWLEAEEARRAGGGRGDG